MQRLAIHIEEGLRKIVDLDDIYYIEATEDDTLIRLASKRRRGDIRRMNTLQPPREKLVAPCRPVVP